MSEYFKNAINILANRQEYSERKQEELQLEIDGWKEKAIQAINAGNFTDAENYLTKLQNPQQALEKIHEEEYRACCYCGETLRPHSINWLEGFHIDGCE